MEDVQSYFKNQRDMRELEDVNNFLEKNKNEEFTEINELQKTLIKNVKMYKTPKTKITIDNSQNELSGLFDKIDKKIQMRDWRKLPKFIQNDKIKEYISRKFDKSEYDKMYKQILVKLKSHKIKGSDIKYNKETCQIDEISFKKNDAK